MQEPASANQKTEVGEPENDSRGKYPVLGNISGKAQQDVVDQKHQQRQRESGPFSGSL
jgi:hypothetical protein